jgi:hypothetical protein
VLIVELWLRVAAQSFVGKGLIDVVVGLGMDVLRVHVGLRLVSDRDVLRHERVVHQAVLLKGVLG